MQDHHICNGLCFDYTIPCNGSCQDKNFYMCESEDQCYRFWDHCDKVAQCDDGSDEGQVIIFREYFRYFREIINEF